MNKIISCHSVNTVTCHSEQTMHRGQTPIFWVSLGRLVIVCYRLYVGLSIESMHYMMSSTLYRVHWSKIHYTESRSPLSFDQLHPAAQSPIRSTLSTSPLFTVQESSLSSHAVLCVVPEREQKHFQFCLPRGSAFLSSLQPWLPILLCSC